MFHGHELRAELLLVQVVESRNLVQPNRRVQLEVRTDLGEEDLLLHLFHKKLRLSPVGGGVTRKTNTTETRTAKQRHTHKARQQKKRKHVRQEQRKTKKNKRRRQRRWEDSKERGRVSREKLSSTPRRPVYRGHNGILRSMQ